MKANNNNTDTLFMDIFVELFAIAKVYFQELFKNELPGTYTIKDIYKYIEKNIEASKKGSLTGVGSSFYDKYAKTLEKSPYYSAVETYYRNKGQINYLCRVSGDVVSIEKDNFKCSFDVIKVFEYLERFKSLSGAKDKLEFTKEMEIKEGQNTTFVEIELSKEDIKSLTSVKTEKRYIVGRYHENTTHLSLTENTMYATNCFVLKTKCNVVKNSLGEINDILIPFDVLKNVGVGSSEFTVIEGKEDTYNVKARNATTNKTVSYSFKKVYRFLDYKAVYPGLYKEMNICLKDTKAFVNCIKTEQKACKELGTIYFMLQVVEGSKEIKVVVCNEADYINKDHKFFEFTFELKESSKFSGNYFYIFDTVLKCLNDWDGNLYFDDCKLSFGAKAVNACFCMCCNDTDNIFDKYHIVANKPEKLTKIEDNNPIQEQKNDNVSANTESKETVSNETKTETTFELSERDKENFNVSECARNGLKLVPKQTTGIECIYIPKDIQEGELFEIHTITGDMFRIVFDGIGIVTSIYNNFEYIEINKRTSNNIFSYLEKSGCRWEQPDKYTFYLIADGKEYIFNNEFEAYLYLIGGEVQPKETKDICNVSKITDEVLELVSLDLNKLVYKVLPGAKETFPVLKKIDRVTVCDKVGTILYYDPELNLLGETDYTDGNIIQCILKDLQGH